MSCLFDLSGKAVLVIGAAVFLASPAGAFTAGQTFVSDGGHAVMGP